MSKEEYIRQKIYDHIEKYNLSISSQLLNDMSMSGSFAFRVLYNETQKITMYNFLNPNNLVFRNGEYDENGLILLSPIWSIDGGERFQWSEREIISIDLGEYRNKVIEELLD